MEGPTPAAVVRPVRPHGHRGPLSHRRLQVQPHRTAPVQPDQPELERRTTEKLRDHPEVHSHHHDLHRTDADCPSGSETISCWHQALRRQTPPTQPHPSHLRTTLELHHPAFSCEVILTRRLSIGATKIFDSGSVENPS